MSEPRHFPASNNPLITSPAESGDPLVALTNLATVRNQMDSLQSFLVDSINRNTLLSPHQMNRVNSELTSAIQQVIVNGANLLAFSQVQPVPLTRPDPSPVNPSVEASDPSPEIPEEDNDDDVEIVELDAVELLAEHIHFCEICGKGFKRDANLRMHMRAHGNQFKTVEALARPSAGGESISSHRRRTRFSCPYVGCNRNQRHRSFRALKSVICVKNHFKRSHCPKNYSCDRCNKKSFSVMADLKSHIKYCGSSRWKCSCGSTFSRKDKLFGHMALFEGHMPAIADEENKTPVRSSDLVVNDGLLEDFGSFDDECFRDLMMAMGNNDNASSSTVVNFDESKIDGFFNF